MEAVCAGSVCRQCSKSLGEKAAGQKRIYCSDVCCRLWVKNHPSLYKHECMFCGKEFESQTKEQKFCSHDCYIRNRFWRQEDTEETPVGGWHAVSWDKNIHVSGQCLDFYQKVLYN